MKIFGNEDLRVQKTVTSIRKTFFEMLLDTELKKISVTNLCQRAKINKKTFYRYYETIDFLVDEIIGEFVDDFIERTKNFRVPEDLDKINREFFIFSVEQGKIYEKIISSPAWQIISKKFVEKIINYTWQSSSQFQKLNSCQKNLLICFVMNVGIELYRQWLSDDKKIPLEEVISISNNLLCHGVFGFFEKK